MPLPPVSALDATLALQPDVTDVAGFSLDAQQVGGTLTISGGGSEDQRLTLDSAASAPGWTVESSQSDVLVPAGKTVSVPVTIHVPPDAPTDLPVRLTVRARDAGGDQVTAFAHLTPRADATPVDPVRTWPVPAGLLGGLDVASLAVGGAPVPSVDPVGEGLLHDGLAISGSGFTAIFRNQPFTLTVDLAGDEPVPVAGFILDPLGGDGSLGQRARSIELQLSTDGVTWQTVHAGDLDPAPDRSADHARRAGARRPSRVSSSGAASAARPGRCRSANGRSWRSRGSIPMLGPRNIADPVRGGHVAWMSPQPDSIQSPAGHAHRGSDTVGAHHPAAPPDQLGRGVPGRSCG